MNVGRFLVQRPFLRFTGRGLLAEGNEVRRRRPPVLQTVYVDQLS